MVNVVESRLKKSSVSNQTLFVFEKHHQWLIVSLKDNVGDSIVDFWHLGRLVLANYFRAAAMVCVFAAPIDAQR